MTVPEAQAWPTKYAVSCLPPDHPESFGFTLQVVWAGGDRWLVTDGFRRSYDTAGTLDYEHSERDDEWIAAHRFDLDTALALAKRMAPTMTRGRWTVEAVLAQEWGP